MAVRPSPFKPTTHASRSRRRPKRAGGPVDPTTKTRFQNRWMGAAVHRGACGVCGGSHTSLRVDSVKPTAEASGARS